MFAITNQERAKVELMPEPQTYTYLGDRSTDPGLAGKNCMAIHDRRGKCIRGRNGAMLVAFGKRRVVVLGRRLRKITA